jgi:hypothetical protein
VIWPGRVAGPDRAPASGGGWLWNSPGSGRLGRLDIRLLTHQTKLSQWRYSGILAATRSENRS